MIDYSLTLELDSVLRHSDPDYLERMVQKDREIDSLQVIKGKNRDTIKIIFKPVCRDTHRVPVFVQELLHQRGIGHTVLPHRRLRRVA